MVAASSEYLVLLLQKPTFNQGQDYETKLILVNTGHKALPASDKISLCQLTHLRWSYSAIGMCFWKFAPRPSAALGNVLHFCSPDYSGTRLSQSGVLHSRCGNPRRVISPMKSFPLLNRFAFCFYPLVDRETLLSREAAQGHQWPGKICLPHFSFLDLPVEPQFMVMEYLLSSNGIHSCLHSQASGTTFSAVGTCSTSTSICFC